MLGGGGVVLQRFRKIVDKSRLQTNAKSTKIANCVDENIFTSEEYSFSSSRTALEHEMFSKARRKDAALLTMQTPTLERYVRVQH